MFSFRNSLSPTTSTMVKLNRSPCTITVHHWNMREFSTAAQTIHQALGLHAALACDDAASRRREAAAVRLMIDLLQDAVRCLEQADVTIDMPDEAPTVRNGRRAVAGAAIPGTTPLVPVNGFAGGMATMLLGAAGALVAAAAFAPGRSDMGRFAKPGAAGVLPGSLPSSHR